VFPQSPLTPTHPQLVIKRQQSSPPLAPLLTARFPSPPLGRFCRTKDQNQLHYPRVRTTSPNRHTPYCDCQRSGGLNRCSLTPTAALRTQVSIVADCSSLATYTGSNPSANQPQTKQSPDMPLGATFVPGGYDDYYIPEVVAPAPQR